jgi:acyl dehydratase
VGLGAGAALSGPAPAALDKSAARRPFSRRGALPREETSMSLPETGPRQEWPLAELQARIGQEIGVSQWIAITQDMIDAFGRVTHDMQALHVDPAEAAKGPFGGTVAHGFLTMSLLAVMAYDAVPSVQGRKTGVNYGFDRLRFIAPVPSGSRVRGRFTLQEVTRRGENTVLMRVSVTVEIEGFAKPALVADWLNMAVL